MIWRPVTIAFLLSGAFGVAGCGIGHIFHHQKAAPAPNTDVTNPGRPLPAPTPTPRTGPHKTGSAAATPKPSAAKATSSAKAKSPFPVAKPVPGKPGLVFNPFKTNGNYIDVSGYAPGSKVKDPDTQKIFVVP
ncbi:MAG TPA: hypothetical protein VKS98_12345 [Chthoniobacterales bacterium]|nr:hypothetical protein [Chthoniobacterales bacterium]